MGQISPDSSGNEALEISSENESRGRMDVGEEGVTDVELHVCVQCPISPKPVLKEAAGSSA